VAYVSKAGYHFYHDAIFHRIDRIQQLKKERYTLSAIKEIVEKES
jgi:DNA-binding transcriptional MerR regulator